jgi:hypothetical protein
LAVAPQDLSSVPTALATPLSGWMCSLLVCVAPYAITTNPGIGDHSRKGDTFNHRQNGLRALKGHDRELRCSRHFAPSRKRDVQSASFLKRNT